MALLEDTPRNATIRTLTDCTFLTLPRDAFTTMLDRDSGLRASFEDIRRDRAAL